MQHPFGSMLIRALCSLKVSQQQFGPADGGRVPGSPGPNNLLGYLGVKLQTPGVTADPEGLMGAGG